MSVTITCYGGVGEVGGNKILVEDGDRRIFFDFGKTFGRRYSDYFDSILLKERTARGLLDALELGLIPCLEGLYRDDLIPVLDPGALCPGEEEYADKKGNRRKRDVTVFREADGEARNRAAFWGRFRQPEDGEEQVPAGRLLPREDMENALPVDAIVLSHAHLDHIGDLAYVQADVPVFSSRMTAFVAKAMQDTGRTSPSGTVYYKVRAPQEDGYLESPRWAKPRWRPWGFLDGAPAGRLDPNDPFASARSFWLWGAAEDEAVGEEASPGEQVDNRACPLGLQYLPVDHSLFGATGFILKTEAGAIAYTGDIRFHGRRGGLSRKFVKQLVKAQPRVLICEGTRAGDTDLVTEEEVEANCLAAVKTAGGGLVIADFSPRNIERLLTFQSIAKRKKVDRTLVILPKDAYLLTAMALVQEPSLAPLIIPDILAPDSHLAVYADPKCSDSKWEGAVWGKYGSVRVGPHQVMEDPGKYILAFSLWDMVDLLDVQHLLQRRPGGVYIYSNSKAYDDEQEIDLLRLWRWIKRYDMQVVGLASEEQEVAENSAERVVKVSVVPGYHSSGHAGSQHLLRMVEQVRPEILIPVHTEDADWWTRELRRAGLGKIHVVPPVYAEPIELSRL